MLSCIFRVRSDTRSIPGFVVSTGVALTWWKTTKRQGSIGRDLLRALYSVGLITCGLCWYGRRWRVEASPREATRGLNTLCCYHSFEELRLSQLEPSAHLSQSVASSLHIERKFC
eukprot:1413413-Amphidinium_carterae.1